MLLITGGNGQLGTSLREFFPADQHFYTDASELNITDENNLADFAALHPLTGIINCAAYNAVDKAEEEPQAARAINTEGARNLARLSAKLQVPLIHISTDYVFDGNGHTPLAETAPTNPLGVYGKTKREGEEAVLQEAYSAAVIRTAWLHSAYGKNFLKTMLDLAERGTEFPVVSDQFGTPTYAPHLAQAIARMYPMLTPGRRDVYHFTNEGAASWYDFAYYILSRKGKEHLVRPIASTQYGTKAKRPIFSVLDKSKIKRVFGLQIPHWMQGVDECLKQLY